MLYSPVGRIGGILQYSVCSQCECSRFYMITKFKEIEQTLTRIRACEQLQIFCKHEQASTHLNLTSKLSKGQILRAFENFYDHLIPLMLLVASCWVPCDGLAFRPGEGGRVVMLLIASCWVPCNGLASHPGGSSNTPSCFMLGTL